MKPIIALISLLPLLCSMTRATPLLPDYDLATSGNKTDVVGAFVDACRKHGVKPGLYYCLLDFRNNTVAQKEQWLKFQLPEDFFQLAKDQLTELVTNYPAVGIYWLDIPRAASEQQRTALYDLLRRKNPGAVVLFNQGWRKDREDPLTIESTQGHTWPSDVLNTEREVFFPPFSPKQSWRGETYFLGYEHCDTLGKDWFWTAYDTPRKTDDLAELYQSTRGAGGNLLLNVGPDRNGKLTAWQIEALTQLKEKIASTP